MHDTVYVYIYHNYNIYICLQNTTRQLSTSVHPSINAYSHVVVYSYYTVMFIHLIGNVNASLYVMYEITTNLLLPLQCTSPLTSLTNILHTILLLFVGICDKL